MKYGTIQERLASYQNAAVSQEEAKLETMALVTGESPENTKVAMSATGAPVNMKKVFIALTAGLAIGAMMMGTRSNTKIPSFESAEDQPLFMLVESHQENQETGKVSCNLCTNARGKFQSPPPGNGKKFVGQGMTCDQAMVELADPQSKYLKKNNGVGCETMQKKWGPICCSTDGPGSVQQQPTPAPHIALKQGEHPVCEICSQKINGQAVVPKNYWNRIAVLYMGNDETCKSLWEKGQTGNIDQKTCNPLRNWMRTKDPCNCAKGTLKASW